MTKNTAVDITHSVDFISQRAMTVFIALASFSNRDDTCFPSIASIAEKCGLSERSVQRAIADLIAMKIVTKTVRYRENNGCTSNIYALKNPLDSDNMTPAPCQTDGGEGDSLSPAIEYDNSFNPSNLTFSVKTDTDAREDAPKIEETEITLDTVLENCELPYIRINYGEDFANILKSAVQRIYYSERLRIGDIVLPQGVVRESLRQLNYGTLEIAIDKLRCNPKRKVKNSSAYLTVLLYNAITEADVDWYCEQRW